MPLFGSSKKSPQEIGKNLFESLTILKSETSDKKSEKAFEDISKQLQACKTILYGPGEQDPHPELISQLAQEFYNYHMFSLLVANLCKLDFESKKEVVQIFGVMLRRQIGARSPTVDHIEQNNEILFQLLKGYENPEIALNSGMILRECIRYESLAKIILSSEKFFDLFKYVEDSTFDIASDAFSTFKELLTRHKLHCSQFLEHEYDKVFTKYRVLLDSQNYVTKRQSLKLLGELLLDRHNFIIMTRYISNPDNLKLMMNLLRDKSRNIQFEAFHVFKVFVANPNKTQPILDILLKNKDKLVEFLLNFHTDRTEDEQFNDEKTYLIKQIRDLQSSSSDGASDH
ncbi:calcium-binding protein 39 [Hydra vulgaris]|uniref:Calcium-binding protein 39 n=1 Tax=Hydra vulgaris TaxID=6087 RepID=A0ABM4B4X2_HYDVU